jgi:hypothetical protein
MKRTTISLPDDLAAAMEREARRRHVSISEVARECLAARFQPSSEGRRKLPFIGIARGGDTDTSERIEEILAEEWGRDCDR